MAIRGSYEAALRKGVTTALHYLKQRSDTECAPGVRHVYTLQVTKVGMVTAWNKSVSAWRIFHVVN